MEKMADIGLIGMAVMGQNLILNLNDKGYAVVAYNRTVAKVDEFLNDAAFGRETVFGAHSVEEFIALLKKPRKIILMVKAGMVVDSFIETLLPFLEKGDLIIDGGNSLFSDTSRRTKYLTKKGILFLGTGISGGEEGARNGPSIMPGGNPQAWPLVKNMFQAIAAKTPDGTPCCDWVGEDGAGHYVKMVHNGIEYGDLQLISESYQLMRNLLGLNHDAMHNIYAEWNNGELNSYLIEITCDIINYKDNDGTPLIEKILDSAGQKGTGKWTGINALELGVPATLISEAVDARSISALKEERIKASKVLKGPIPEFTGNQNTFINELGEALLASKIVSYAQGFMLLQAAVAEYNWHLDYGNIAMLWRNGCIIRSAFLDKIKAAYVKNPNLPNLLMDDYFKSVVDRCQDSWRKIVSTAVINGIPLPAISSALAFYDSYRSERLPANLIQAQRDYFGAHTYERNDSPRGEYFHTNWTGSGGNVSANVYSG